MLDKIAKLQGQLDRATEAGDKRYMDYYQGEIAKLSQATGGKLPEAEQAILAEMSRRAAPPPGGDPRHGALRGAASTLSMPADMLTTALSGTPMKAYKALRGVFPGLPDASVPTPSEEMFKYAEGKGLNKPPENPSLQYRAANLGAQNVVGGLVGAGSSIASGARMWPTLSREFGIGAGATYGGAVGGELAEGIDNPAIRQAVEIGSEVAGGGAVLGAGALARKGRAAMNVSRDPSQNIGAASADELARMSPENRAAFAPFVEEGIPVGLPAIVGEDAASKMQKLGGRASDVHRQLTEVQGQMMRNRFNEMVSPGGPIPSLGDTGGLLLNDVLPSIGGRAKAAEAAKMSTFRGHQLAATGGQPPTTIPTDAPRTIDWMQNRSFGDEFKGSPPPAIVKQALATLTEARDANVKAGPRAIGQPQPGMNWEALWNMRKGTGKKVGAAQSSGGMFDDASTGELKKIYKTETQDLMADADRHGFGDAFRDYTNEVKSNRGFAEDVADPLAKAGGKARNQTPVGTMLYNYMVKEPAKLDALFAKADDVQRGQMVSGLVGDMFKPTNSVSSSIDGASPQSFLTRYNKANADGGMEAMLRQYAPDMKPHFDNFVSMARKLRDADKVMRNPSGTAGAIVDAVGNNALTSATAIGMVLDPSLGTIGTAGSLWIAKKLKDSIGGSMQRAYQNPAFVKESLILLDEARVGVLNPARLAAFNAAAEESGDNELSSVAQEITQTVSGWINESGN